MGPSSDGRPQPMESEDAARLLVLRPEEAASTRHHCGCTKTSDKLRHILKSFPEPQPPSPPTVTPASFGYGCKRLVCAHASKAGQPGIPENVSFDATAMDVKLDRGCEIHGAIHEQSCPWTHEKEGESRACPLSGVWDLAADLLVLVQLAVSATALLLYYVIFCYMQLVYFALKIALYFHEADRPMKITIAVTVISALILAVNLIWRLERFVGILSV